MPMLCWSRSHLNEPKQVWGYGSGPFAEGLPLVLGVSHEMTGRRKENPCGDTAGAGTDEEEEKHTVKQLEVGVACFPKRRKSRTRTISFAWNAKDSMNMAMREGSSVVQDARVHAAYPVSPVRKIPETKHRQTSHYLTLDGFPSKPTYVGLRENTARWKRV